MKLLGDLLRVSWELSLGVLRAPTVSKLAPLCRATLSHCLASDQHSGCLSSTSEEMVFPDMAVLLLAEPFPVEEVVSGEMKTWWAFAVGSLTSCRGTSIDWVGSRAVVWHVLFLSVKICPILFSIPDQGKIFILVPA